MSTKLSASLAIVSGVLLFSSAAYAQTPLGSDFTYQGRLTMAGMDVNDPADFEFTLWQDDISLDPNDVVGVTHSISNVSVVDGRFAVELDFGANVFNGDARWLEIAVRSPAGSGAYTTLSPRQPLTAAPYAMQTRGLFVDETTGYVGIGTTTPAESLDVDGVVHASGAVSSGNSITIDGVTDQVRSTGNLEIHTASGRALRIEDDPNSPNIIGGHSQNSVAAGAIGATIAGGGLDLQTSRANHIKQSYCTIGGGRDNEAGGDALLDNDATVAGGRKNLASGNNSAVGGGYGNIASGQFSTVSGGYENTASGFHSSIQGGRRNTASGAESAVLGGESNIADGDSATVLGGRDNEAGGKNSVAAGHHAKVRDQILSGDADGDEGTFVWADSTPAEFVSTGPDQFLIRASGGVGIGTNAPDNQLTVAGDADFTDRVGIGTNAPASELHVSGGDASVNLRLEADVNDSDENAQPSLTWSQDGGGVTADLGFVDGVNRFAMRTEDGTPGSNVDIIFEPDGNVGVGTAMPDALLHVEGPDEPQLVVHQSENSGADAGIVVRGSRFASASDVDVAYIELRDFDENEGGGTDFAMARIAAGQQATSGQKGLLRFSTNDGAGVEERMRITSSGRVGIGASAPAGMLHVEKSTNPDITFKNSGDEGSLRAVSINFDHSNGTGAEIRAERDPNDSDGMYLSFATQPPGGAITDRVVISPSGNVGIGTNAPRAPLHVQETINVPMIVDRIIADGALIRFDAGLTDGVGSITVTNGIVSYNAFTGSHFAMTEMPIEFGELVIATGRNRRSQIDPRSEPIYGVEPSATANDSRCLGAYFGITEPNRPVGEDNRELVMAVGNGEMWVIDIGRDVRPGDYLISSDVRGHAMLDDPDRFSVGYVVARAAEPVIWSDVSESINGRKHRRISVFFESFVRGSAAVAAMQHQIDALTERVDRFDARLKTLGAEVAEDLRKVSSQCAESRASTDDIPSSRGHTR